MSTKNLARTVIEGGRNTGDKYDRRMSLRWLRHDTRRFCRDVRTGVVDCDGIPAPVRDVPYRWRDEIHADKTQPCSRFLRSRSGRPWNDVRSEIHRKFNTNTLAGWHVVYAHLIDAVETNPVTRGFGYFWVDADGILRSKQRKRWYLNWLDEHPDRAPA